MLQKLFILLLFSCKISLAIDLPSLKPEYESKISLKVVDSQNGNILYQLNSAKSRLIASNVKLFTSLYAIQLLGEDFRWHTKLYYIGEIKSGTLYGNLYLQGGGDPTLDSQALLLILSQLKLLKINKIHGNFIIDDTVFNSKPSYSMLESQAFDSDTVSPSGLIIDKNLVILHLKSFESAIKPTISSNLYSYELINNLNYNSTQENNCNGLYQKINLQLIKKNVIISGKISKACKEKDLTYNLLPNNQFNQMKIQQALDLFSIKLAGNYLLSPVPAKAINIYDYSSPVLEHSLIEMNHLSDNLIAQALLLTPAAYLTKNKDTFVEAKKLFDKFLITNKLYSKDFKLENGAGLSRYELFNTDNIVDLLSLINTSLFQANFEATLPTAGKYGTLHNSFKQFNNQLHAKTGTLNDASALAGYFYANNGHKYVFSFLANDINTKNSDQMLYINNWLSNVFIQLNKLARK